MLWWIQSLHIKCLMLFTLLLIQYYSTAYESPTFTSIIWITCSQRSLIVIYLVYWWCHRCASSNVLCRTILNHSITWFCCCLSKIWTQITNVALWISIIFVHLIYSRWSFVKVFVLYHLYLFSNFNVILFLSLSLFNIFN